MLTIEKGNELLPGALSAEGKCNGGEAVDGVQTEKNIIVLVGAVSLSSSPREEEE